MIALAVRRQEETLGGKSVWVRWLVGLLALPMLLFCLVVLASTVLPGWPLVAPETFIRVIDWAAVPLFFLVLVSALAARAGGGPGWREVVTRRTSPWPGRWGAGSRVRQVLAAPRSHLGTIALALVVVALVGIGLSGANKDKGLAGDPAMGTYTRYDPAGDRTVPISAERYWHLQRQGQRTHAAMFALYFLFPAVAALGRSKAPAPAGGPGAAPITG